ncbi:16S rRNA (cytosine(967)-C(5))-methyltransferase RsmB [bacterium]|nr:16S rRNA (cytosine(967)-C(5))-methyltransferase RsmB [bacterium]
MKKKTSQPQTAREVALRLLSRVENEGAYTDRIMTSPLMKELETRDRSFVREMVPGVIRWKMRLDRIINIYYNKNPSELDQDIRNVLRLGLFQIMFMDSIPEWAAVNESVTIAVKTHGKGAGGLVNALLRRFLREGEPDKWPSDTAERLSLELSHPLWIARRWIDAFGENIAESIMRQGNEKHPVFVRTGRIGTSMESLAEALDHEGFETEPVTGMPEYLSVSKANGLFDSVAFRDGLFIVQDPSAGMATVLLAPQPGEQVLDLCCAPGGKAIHAASLMHDQGRITAVDKHQSRLGLVEETAGRLGFTILEFREDDAVTFGRDSEERYDRVLLDVPCSGTGVFSKRPDLKWRLTDEDVTRIASLQREMLDNAAGQVKPGGVLVYSTCTLEHEENEDTVADFLEQHHEFTIDHDSRFTAFERGPGYLIFPHQMEGVGAFAAKLRKE